MRQITKIIISGYMILFTTLVHAIDLEVDILNSSYKALPIVISDFYTDAKSKPIYNKIKDIIAYDLNNSGAFDLRFTATPLIKTNINLQDSLNEFNIDTYKHYYTVIVGKITDNQKQDYYLIEVAILKNDGTFLKKFGYRLFKNNIKQDLVRIARDISNEIYTTNLAIEGYFTSSLLFANGNRLVISDYDGTNQELVVKAKGKVLSPSFSHDGKMIVYADFFEGKSAIYIYDMYFKKNIKLADFDGISLSPKFARDDSKVVLSISKDGVTNIYEVLLDEKHIKKLTHDNAISIPGNYTEDTKSLVFNSDRSGSPKIYIFDTNSASIDRISKEEGSYYNPSFAHKLNLILFTKILRGKFKIGVLAKSGKEKIVSQDIAAESPSWLIDDRHIIYQYAYKKNQNGNVLYAFYIMDLLSGYKLKIQPEVDSQDPRLSSGVIFTKKISAKYFF